jgi:C4-dicarboxylate-specific signal transduction histidine kinase
MNDISMAADLQGRAERHAMLVAHMPTPIWLLDVGGVRALLEPLAPHDLADHLQQHPDLAEAALDRLRVIEVNRAAVALLRADDPARLLRSARHLFTAAPGLVGRVIAASLTVSEDWVEDARLATFDGGVREVVMTVACAAQDVAVVTARDITEQRHAEAQLRRLRADFAHAARISILGELATSIAHEIRQPLAAIVTNADTSLRWLARDEPNVAKVAELTERIAASAQRANDIIQRVRGMALKQEPERMPINLADVVDDALHFVRHDLDAHGIALDMSVAEGLAPVVGDRVQLQQVLVNLLVNGIHAIDQSGPDARRIELRAESASAEAVALTVRDTGDGIAEAHVAHLFDGFFSTKATGMGIGLTICRSIVSEHGGEIRATNHPDGGALFRVTLPFAAAPQ